MKLDVDVRGLFNEIRAWHKYRGRLKTFSMSWFEGVVDGPQLTHVLSLGGEVVDLQKPA